MLADTAADRTAETEGSTEKSGVMIDFFITSADLWDTVYRMVDNDTLKRLIYTGNNHLISICNHHFSGFRRFLHLSNQEQALSDVTGQCYCWSQNTVDCFAFMGTNFVDWTKITNLWGSKFKAIVFFFIIHYFVDTRINCSHPQTDTQGKLSHPQ